jgi:hypothetical protein
MGRASSEASKKATPIPRIAGGNIRSQHPSEQGARDADERDTTARDHSSHQSLGRNSLDHSLENLAAKALGEYLQNKGTTPRSPTRPGYSQEQFPGQQRSEHALPNEPPPPGSQQQQQHGLQEQGPTERRPPASSSGSTSRHSSPPARRRGQEDAPQNRDGKAASGRTVRGRTGKPRGRRGRGGIKTPRPRQQQCSSPPG